MVQRSERRHDERNRLREATREEIAELRDADVDDEPSEVDARVAHVAAKAAAHTVRHMSQPDSDAPADRPAPWHQKPAGKAGAILALLGALATLVEALRHAGLLR
jgi:hypothetical protein